MKTIFITGASSGLGRACIKVFSNKSFLENVFTSGSNVVVH